MEDVLNKPQTSDLVVGPLNSVLFSTATSLEAKFASVTIPIDLNERPSRKEL